MAQGVITSVKDPADTIERVVRPANEAADAAGRPRPNVLATRWSIQASNEDEAWEALYSWRGLRAPGRLEAVDPLELRQKADEMPRDEVLGRYSLVGDADSIIETYRPLVEGLGADVVCFQMASLDQEALIETLGSEVLPAMRKLGS
jgi:coenzyme F420-dependent glucose-6-phosphate dehydrogenase